MHATPPGRPMRRDRTRGTVAVVVAAALWGLGGVVAGRLFAQGVQPLALVAVRTYISALGLTAVAWSQSARRRPARARRDRPAARHPGARRTVVAYGLAIAAANAGLFTAIRNLPVAVAMVLQALAPLIVLLWIAAATRRRPRTPALVGTIAALPGVGLMVHRAGAVGPAGANTAVGVAAGLGTAVMVAVFTLLGTRVNRDYDAVTGTAAAFAAAAVAWLGFQAVTGTAVPYQSSVLPGVLTVSVLGTLLPFALYTWGVHHAGPTAAAASICLEPLFSAVIAWPWLNQALSAAQIAGGVVVLAAVAVVSRRDQFDGQPPGEPAEIDVVVSGEV